MTLEEYIRENGLKIKYVALDLGLSRQHIYDIINGKSFPSRLLAMKIEEWSKKKVRREELLFPKEEKCAKKAWKN